MEKLLNEFLGTFALVYMVLATGNAYAIGVTLLLAVLLGGGAYNPAVAVGMWMAKKITQVDLLPVILAELIGALAAYELFRRYGRISL